MRKTLTLILALTVCLLFSLPATAAKEAKDPKAGATVSAPASVVIDAAAKKQAPVTFPHDKHVKLGKPCDTCHHTNKGLTAESKVKVEKCSSCHMKAEGKMSTMADMNLEKNPMHNKCVGCHKAEKKGPTSCVKCHVKK